MPKHETNPEVGVQQATAAPGDRRHTPQQPGERREPEAGSTRRDFFATVALAAAVLGCRGSPPPGPPPPAAPPPPAEAADLSADIRAVRAHVLKLESPPSFVFTTRFRDVP